jgi:hypothetical protein
MVFFQACWGVLKEDTMNAFHDFYARGKFEKVLMQHLFLLFQKYQGLLILMIFDLLI